jgi:ABC-type phosphate/phosphonate transport system substrate-binding protein
MSDSTILVGAVAYDPKAVTIWEGIREHYSDQGIAEDFVLFSNYERQVESLLQGHIDVAWNTPLAHARVRRRTHHKSVSLGMRDSDRDFSAKIVVRQAAGLKSIQDLDRFRKGLFSMKWENPRHRRVLELEGLKMWMPPREEGYASLHEALDLDEKK